MLVQRSVNQPVKGHQLWFSVRRLTGKKLFLFVQSLKLYCSPVTRDATAMQTGSDLTASVRSRISS